MFKLVIVAVLAIVIVASSLVSADGKEPGDFRCSLCLDFAKRVVKQNENPETACRPQKPTEENKMLDACTFFFEQHPEVVKAALKAKQTLLRYNNNDEQLALRRAVCESTDMCESHQEVFGHLRDSALKHDVKVAAAGGARAGFDSLVRITVIDQNSSEVNHSSAFLDKFTCNQNFKWYAKEHAVHSGLFRVTPGKKTTINFGSELSVDVNLPVRGKGIRAVAWGDPCYSSEYVHCEWGKKWQVLPRMVELLNLLASQNKEGKEASIDMYQILGDDFYDPFYELGPRFFTQLSPAARGLVALTIAGNHDFYEHGDPIFSGRGDTYGNTYSQAFGQDSIAAVEAGAGCPFNLSIDSAAVAKKSGNAAAVVDITNTVSWTSVGNIAYIAWASVYDQESLLPYFEKACAWVAATKPEFLVVTNHWSEENCGAKPNTDSKDGYEKIMTIPGCKEMGSRVKYQEGHQHENKVVMKNTGVRLGGAGMSSGLEANFGVPFFDSHGRSLKIWYFPIANVLDHGDAAWKKLIDCVTAKGGLHLCTEECGAKLFVNETLPN